MDLSELIGYKNYLYRINKVTRAAEMALKSNYKHQKEKEKKTTVDLRNINETEVGRRKDFGYISKVSCYTSLVVRFRKLTVEKKEVESVFYVHVEV